MKDILVINGNPKKESLCSALAESYRQGVAESGGQIQLIHLSGLDFDMNLSLGYEKGQEPEPDLAGVQRAIRDASHVVIVSPVWWGTMPAKLKGLFDRVLLPGFAFEYQEGSPFPRKLLKGKTARLIITMDSPVWYYRLILGDPIVKTLGRPTLGLCGIKVGSVSRFGPVIGSSEAQRERWIQKVKQAGVEDSKR